MKIKIKKQISITIVAVFWVMFFIREVLADTLYLKNGRRVEGIIKSESDEKVELDIGFGVMGFSKKEIERIDKSDAEELEVIHQRWENQKLESAKRKEEAKLKEEFEPKHAEVLEENGQLIVDTVLNRKVHAALILDTGASCMILSKKVAEALGINLNQPVTKKDEVQLTVADGRRVKAKRYILDWVSVKGVEAENIEAAVMLEDVPDVKLKEGLLGMSFLSRFSFKIDSRAKKLILEKLR